MGWEDEYSDEMYLRLVEIFSKNHYCDATIASETPPKSMAHHVRRGASRTFSTNAAGSVTCPDEGRRILKMRFGNWELRMLFVYSNIGI